VTGAGAMPAVLNGREGGGRMAAAMSRWILLLALLAPLPVGAAHARFGRIDVYSAKGDFNCRDIRVSAGAQFLDVGWRGKGKARTGGTAQARVRERWREVWIEVTPEADGKLQINFQGEYYRKQAPDDVRLVWVDDVRVTGATLVNGDLEELDGAGMPRGWFFGGRLPEGAISRDGRVAESGKVCVAVWYGAQLRQLLDAKAGRPVRVTARFRALGPEVEPRDVAEHKAQFASMLETRRQTVTVRLASAEAAKRARIRPLPLYGGAQWAITSRWDDNNSAHVKMRETLLAHGHRGTFFLNDPATSDVGRRLVGDGITLGGHSLTHPMLTYQNRNRIFEEALGVRVALEAAFDRPVNAYAFSFCNYRSAVEGLAVQRDIAVALGRAGYLQVANHRFAAEGCWPLGVASLLPPDGRPIDNAFAGFLADEDMATENPAITFSMHTWYRTPAAWAKFAGELDRYGPRPAWWHCSHNAYGAYRAQVVRAARGRLTRDGDRVSFTFERPMLIDLNDPVPLTFEIAGVRPAEVKAIEAAGASVQRVDGKSGPLRFHLGHPPGSRLPARIDRVRTDDGKLATSAEFPGVEASLSFEGDGLRLRLRNGGPDPLERVRVAYRLPVVARQGVVRRPRFGLAAGQTRSDARVFGEVRADPRYRAGVAYAVAQIDFARSGVVGRLYVETHARAVPAATSYPRDGFVVLGPIPRDGFGAGKVDAASVRETGWPLGGGRKLAFAAIAPQVAQPLNAEVIAVRGQWSNRGLKPCVYLLASTIVSPKARSVRFLHSSSTVRAVWLNARRAEGVGDLRSGENTLLLVYEPPVTQRFSPEHAGPMFRIVDARTRERLTDVVYQPR